MKVSAQYAREHFEELEAAADRGEEVEIARESRPALMLVPKTIPVAPAVRRPRSELFRALRDKMWVSPDFDSPELNKEIEDEFLNGPVFPEENR